MVLRLFLSLPSCGSRFLSDHILSYHPDRLVVLVLACDVFKSVVASPLSSSSFITPQRDGVRYTTSDHGPGALEGKQNVSVNKNGG